MKELISFDSIVIVTSVTILLFVASFSPKHLHVIEKLNKFALSNY